MSSGRQPRRKRGFSYAEMLLATLLLSLCAGFLWDTVALGVRQSQRRTHDGRAVMLLETLCAAVRNDLQYATKYYTDHSFERVVRDYAAKRDYAVRTWYGAGLWRGDASGAESETQWREIHDSGDFCGQIIRKSALSGGQYFFDCPAPPESYADEGELCAQMEILPISTDGALTEILTGRDGTKIDRFAVTVRIYGGPDGGENPLVSREIVVVPVQPLTLRESGT